MSFMTNFTATRPAEVFIGSKSSCELDLAIWVRISCFSLVALVLWRTWRFTIWPFLHADEPKEYPYWIPIIGHGRRFFLGFNELINTARSHFGNTKDPFALTAFGIKFYVVTQAKHSAEVFRNTETLSFEEFVQTLMRFNGNDESIIKAVYTALPTKKDGFPNPHGESLGQLAQRMHAHQLNPGENLVTLQKQVRDWLDSHLTLAHFSTFSSAVPISTDKKNSGIEVPLYRWCSEIFIRVGQDVYFGDKLAEIDPDLPLAFLAFDELIWKMLYQYPRFMSGDMTTPRARVIDGLRRYFEVPQSQRSHGSAWLIDAMEDEMRAIGVNGRNLAVVMFHLYFAINTNARKTVFWLLSHLLFNPELLAEYRKETAAAFDASGELVDPFLIQDPTCCPLVDGVWHETLRMTGWAASVRLVTADTVIGGKLMRQGNRVVVPHRLLHFDAGVFGAEPSTFRPERWMQGQTKSAGGGNDQNNSKTGANHNNNLARSSSWRPFGAGKTICSGRFLARFSVTVFVATFLHRFDVQLVGEPPFPKADKSRPLLGTMSIEAGSDFRVRISDRRL